MRHTIFLGGALMLLVLACAQKQTKPLETALAIETTTDSAKNKSKEIDVLIRAYTNLQGFNGSVLVAQKGNVLLQKGYGYANMEWEVLNTPDTKFQIGSLSKSFTAMLILRAVSEGKLQLHVPISWYLPILENKPLGTVTIHQLLTHSSGLPRTLLLDDKKQYTPEQMVLEIAKQKIDKRTTPKFVYSNMGYTVLGYLLELRYNTSFNKLLQRKIAKPLGMSSTGFVARDKVLPKKAQGYYFSWGNFYATKDGNMSKAYASGGIYSSVLDLYKWSKAWHNNQILPKELRDLYVEKHIVDAKTKGHYAYGLEIVSRTIGETSNKIQTIGHTGVISSYRSLMIEVPKLDATIVLLANTNRAFLNGITERVIAILKGVDYSLPKKSLAMQMEKVIAASGADAGVSFFKNHQNNSDYYTNEQELIVAGYRLLNQADAKGAAKIFALAIALYPEQDNPYDSYAEAMLALDKTEEAIKYYKISLNKNPNNTNAKKMLEKIEIKC